MITTDQYFQAKPHTVAQEAAAVDLLDRVNKLTLEAEAAGRFTRRVDPDTGTEISGSKGGAGDGGFRLESASTGGGHSSHKILYVQQPDGTWSIDPGAKAGVDCFDPREELDAYLDDFEVKTNGAPTGRNTKLEEHGLYREDPDSTRGWCHLTTRAPRSGRRTFKP